MSVTLDMCFVGCFFFGGSRDIFMYLRRKLMVGFVADVLCMLAQV